MAAWVLACSKDFFAAQGQADFLYGVVFYRIQWAIFFC